MPRKQSETVQLKLRFPERLRIRIEAEAEKNARSMNAEIVHRLEQSFEKDDRTNLARSAAREAMKAYAEKVGVTLAELPAKILADLRAERERKS